VRAESSANSVSDSVGLVTARMATATLQKTLGAFYTGQPAADRLVEWAICNASESVLDPSCGDGVFVGAAYSRLRQLGCDFPDVCGVDISEDALRSARERVESARLVQEDFFNLTRSSLGRFDCVVGNPPFIRYQTFNGDKDSLGHKRAKEAGVSLPRLASSWAPFLVHASSFLRRGGRLGMVMPSELGHSMYAREVLRFLIRTFRHVAVEMFRDKLFEDLSQSTVLLFCEGYGEPNRAFIVTSSDDLEGNDRQIAKVDPALIASGRFRFTQYLVPQEARSLYEGLTADKRIQRLSDVANVGIGYVTGANDFFHLSAEECRRWEIPKRFLRPCLLNLREFKGLEYDLQCWRDRRTKGEKVYLLALPPCPADTLPTSVQGYLRHGELKGLRKRYKCRIRQFWHAVPHVRIADAFLSYMSGAQPLLVTNAAHLVAPNTVHVLRFNRNSDSLAYAASWKSSLTRLSCELEGHALGGGLFKLEPSEAGNVLVVRPRATTLRGLMSRIRLGGFGSPEQFSDIADRYLLRDYLGLSPAECVLLREAAGKIESWRKHR
jgi:adenine-specific DNA-methyltransferase